MASETTKASNPMSHMIDEINYTFRKTKVKIYDIVQG